MRIRSAVSLRPTGVGSDRDPLAATPPRRSPRSPSSPTARAPAPTSCCSRSPPSSGRSTPTTPAPGSTTRRAAVRRRRARRPPTARTGSAPCSSTSWRSTPEQGPDPDLLRLDRLLHRRRGHPLRRSPRSASSCCAAPASPPRSAPRPRAGSSGSTATDRTVLLDARLSAHADPCPDRVRRHCAHEVAFCVLTGLAERFARARRRQPAAPRARAAAALPVDDAVRRALRPRPRRGFGRAPSGPGGAQAAQALGDLLRRVRGEGEPQRGVVRRAGEERVAGHERDVVRERAVEQLGGVPAVGQPRPHEHAAVGVVVRRAGRERVGEPGDQRVAARAVRAPQLARRARRGRRLRASARRRPGRPSRSAGRPPAWRSSAAGAAARARAPSRSAARARRSSTASRATSTRSSSAASGGSGSPR